MWPSSAVDAYVARLESADEVDANAGASLSDAGVRGIL